jgi:hypothetical protein
MANQAFALDQPGNVLYGRLLFGHTSFELALEQDYRR